MRAEVLPASTESPDKGGAAGTGKGPGQGGEDDAARHVLWQLCFGETWWGKSLDTMLTDLESAINSLIEVYHNYSLLKGNYHAVYRDDLKRLLETECPKFLKKKDADTWFKELDINQDGGINFEEFLVLVIKVGLAAHEDIHKE
ncbi:hypothetical protein AB1E18_002537 [Capra hircus]